MKKLFVLLLWAIPCFAVPKSVVVINASVVKSETSSLTKVGFMTAASQLTADLKQTHRPVWVEVVAGLEPFVEYFEVEQADKGRVIASISVWNSWAQAKKFMESDGHREAMKSYAAMFDPARTVKIAYFLDEPLPNSVRLLELARPRYFVEKILTHSALLEKLKAPVDGKLVFDPRQGPQDPP
jgi:hypothetical protein